MIHSLIMRKSSPKIESDVDLTTMNTMGVQATAGTFVNIQSIEELRALYDSGFFEEHDPIVLGGGSNMLMINDPAEPILKMSITGVNVETAVNDKVLLTAGAGEDWHKLVDLAVEKGLGGIENLALIPGTAGAAPIQNIGAYGVELMDSFVQLTAFNTQSGEVEIFNRDECRFGYRDSIFKNELKGARIICDISLNLSESGHKLETGYRALADHLREKGVENPGLGDIFDSVVEIRRSKLPDPAKIGNAGSFFKNPVVSQNKYDQLISSFPNMPSYPIGEEKYKLPAAWFIDQAGWKGKQFGNVGTYKNQALVLVNLGGATGSEIYDHALKIRNSVKEKFEIDLKSEVNIIGRLH